MQDEAMKDEVETDDEFPEVTERRRAAETLREMTERAIATWGDLEEPFESDEDEPVREWSEYTMLAMIQQASGQVAEAVLFNGDAVAVEKAVERLLWVSALLVRASRIDNEALDAEHQRESPWG